RIRETLFNWLAPHLEGAKCLDRCAGPGALGLEALSRGARHATFVEQAAAAVRQLEKNIDVVAATSAATVFRGDALDYVRGADMSFDIVFLDPPFAADILGETCRLLDERKLLVDGGLVYLELDRTQDEPALPDGWETIRSKTAGNVRYMLVRTGS
ncbi:MAG TPA: 16S rRNA (guanine(966)-N(2))-methyltransferase RsmD, partial [Woeseiaceae bacterium]|nr:16S rRNA (guanine(966)-N(2))-methyltransferase RsmD [Woeseiaceae bacterium]